MSSIHSFHIPVMGLGFTVDSPLKVAKFGISSAVSIMDDHLLEEMRRIYFRKFCLPYIPIEEHSDDYRARRVQAYLDMLDQQVKLQLEEMINESLIPGTSLFQYFDMLDSRHPLYVAFQRFLSMPDCPEKTILSQSLIEGVKPGSIDVNIMTKVDKTNFDKEGGELPRIYSDALSALRGFAMSTLQSAVVFSAGMNPALYSYMEEFEGFFPDSEGCLRKRVILKVSDYRSAMIQGRFLAKKGIWVSEFRIESGLNCGGHAFATDGLLIGPILEEFKIEKNNLRKLLLETCQQALKTKEKNLLPEGIAIKITYQGGLGNSQENQFLMAHYELDGTGWGSPFLLVPEATSVDQDTLARILNARKSDFYLSHASPLGIPFNNLRTSSGEEQRKKRIEKNRPGSPCYKKFLTFSTEFSEKPICTASRQYQNLKMKGFKSGEVSRTEIEEVLEKDCLCEGLSAPAILNAGANPKRNLNAVTICPGPNLAYFKGTFSLKEMADHIYGKIHINLDKERPHVFVKELQLYVDFLKKDIQKKLIEPNAKYEAYVDKFSSNLLSGIKYYKDLGKDLMTEAEEIKAKFQSQLEQIERELTGFLLISKSPFEEK